LRRHDFELAAEALCDQVVCCAALPQKAPEESSQLVARERLTPIEEELGQLRRGVALIG